MCLCDNFVGSIYYRAKVFDSVLKCRKSLTKSIIEIKITVHSNTIVLIICLENIFEQFLGCQIFMLKYHSGQPQFQRP